MIYLAHPFWSDSATIREERYKCVVEAGRELARLHKAQFLSPLLQGYVIDSSETFGREYWISYSLALLSRCDSVLILPLTGWTESKGLQREIAAARTLGFPIHSPAQFRLPHPGPEKATDAWHGGPAFVTFVNS